MSLLGFLTSAGGEAISKPINAVGEVLDGLFTSDEEKLDKELAKKRLEQVPLLGQIQMNLLNAQDKNWWNSGWRPYIGWICGTALGMYYLPQFFMATVLWTRMAWNASELPVYPITDISGLTELLIALLGLGVLRTFEKAKGITK